MAPPDVSVERHSLRWSMVITAMFGVLGVIWGVVSESQMILLDGVYAVLGLAVTWLLLMASGLAQAEPCHRYPSGRESLTPLVIGVQGFVLLATLGYAAFDATLTIREGGEHEVRLALGERLGALPYDIWLTAEFSPRTVDDAARPMADEQERAGGDDG